MSKICQFSINDGSGHFDQFTMVMKMIQVLSNSEIDKIDEEII